MNEKMGSVFGSISLGLVCLAVVGCGADPKLTVQSGRSFDPAWIADSEPSDPISVAAARQSVEHDQVVHIEGRIGGTSQPFVQGLAAFSLVDFSIPDCCDENCTTPECSPQTLAASLATVKFVDAGGKPLATDARELLRVKEKDAVVVQGRAQRDPHGNLVVLAEKIFIRPGS